MESFFFIGFVFYPINATFLGFNNLILLHFKYYVVAIPRLLFPQQSQLLYLFSVDCTALHRVDSSSVYTTVTENIGKSYYVLLL